MADEQAGSVAAHLIARAMMDFLEDGFASGAIIDWLMLLLIVEGAALAAFARNRSGWHGAALDAACIVVPGLFLMLAVKLALVDADWRLIGIALAAAGVVHACDVVRRLRN